MTQKSVRQKGFGEVAKKKLKKITPPTSMEDFLSDEPELKEQNLSLKKEKIKETVTEKENTEPKKTEGIIEKKRTTVYLSIESLDNLDDVWMKLRRMANSEMRTSISKSMIVEYAAKILKDELDEKGRGAKIAKAIFKS